MAELVTPGAQAFVRGHSTFNQKAHNFQVFLARAFDLAVVLFVAALVFRILRLLPIPDFLGLATLSGMIGIYFLPQLIVFKKTFGDLLWNLKRNNIGYVTQDHTSITRTFFSTLGTTFMVLACLGVWMDTIGQCPIWMPATPWNLQALAPPAPNSERSAMLNPKAVVPFFYTIGVWPTHSIPETEPAYYSVLYEKGPPSHFVGHIAAQFGSKTRLLIEGPKTPEGVQNLSRGVLKTCFESKLPTPACAMTRTQTLRRHIQEMRAFSPHTYTLRWFNISETETQGIFVSATGPLLTQDRFIVISRQGLHQAFILTRPSSQQDEGSQILQQAIRTLRVYDALSPGRNWIDRELQQIQLGVLSKKLTPMQLKQRLAEIQQLLISRISVDPASLDSYFHLAGTSSLLLDTLIKIGGLETLGKTAAIQNLQSARSYALDIAPTDSKTLQIQNIWLDFQKKL